MQEEEEGEDPGPAEEPEELMKWFGRDWTATASLRDTGRAHSTGDCFEDVGLPALPASTACCFGGMGLPALPAGTACCVEGMGFPALPLGTARSCLSDCRERMAQLRSAC